MRLTARRALFAAAVLALAVVAVWLIRAARAPVAAAQPANDVQALSTNAADPAPLAVDAGRLARLATKRPPPNVAGTTPLAPLPAATLAYYDRPGVRPALLQLRAITRRRCATLVQFPDGERRITFRISSVLTAAGALEATSVEPDGGRAAECIRAQMRTVHLPAADGPTPLQINLSFLY
jgi:hypothetical protein